MLLGYHGGEAKENFLEMAALQLLLLWWPTVKSLSLIIISDSNVPLVYLRGPAELLSGILLDRQVFGPNFCSPETKTLEYDG